VPWEQEGDLPISVGGEGGYVVHCVEIAFWCAMHRPSLEEALIFLAEAGGDTDTNAAVAGALLGARDGEASIPPRWLDQLAPRAVCPRWPSGWFGPARSFCDGRLYVRADPVHHVPIHERDGHPAGGAPPRQLNRTARRP